MRPSAPSSFAPTCTWTSRQTLDNMIFPLTLTHAHTHPPHMRVVSVGFLFSPLEADEFLRVAGTHGHPADSCAEPDAQELTRGKCVCHPRFRTSSTTIQVPNRTDTRGRDRECIWDLALVCAEHIERFHHTRCPREAGCSTFGYDVWCCVQAPRADDQPRPSLTSRRNLRPSAREGIPTVESTMGTQRGIMIA